ncbi:Phospholipase A(2) [Purpureocillium takamizusanense]|uniref:Lysophospholipase n=1 Tax=Purpureocillium takamizusanense TaxID=2060973 RepID=A0A9Q8QLR1_9HYPO|nr:Phospholipase A(2) [Purpureocillium takamizusanense]UNI22043.1 Phospholipase A(2) [Purpureocillium takamizusanense]
MRRIDRLTGPLLATLRRAPKAVARPGSPLPRPLRRGFFTKATSPRLQDRIGATLPAAIITSGLFVWWLYPSDDFAELSSTPRGRRHGGRDAHADLEDDLDHVAEQDNADDQQDDQSAWTNFARRFESISLMSDLEWTEWSDRLVGFILPEWSKLLPGYMRKLQRELSMSPGSLADEIWQEAHDPLANPEIRYSARVRVSSDLCDEEKEYLSRRRKVARVALAKYLGLGEEDVHPDDVPTIAMCGSGGGLRALIAGTGSLLATEEDGLFDCVTYTAGVSGSCWLQTLYLSSFTGSIGALLEHLKARASTHIAYPPVAFHSLISLPTSKYLLSGLVEKLKGDSKADFGLVDIYGLLLGARYLVPKGELGVNDRDFKLSNQRDYVKLGQRPLPIYTAVRHEIPQVSEDATASPSEAAKEQAKQEAWFQWFEITPYEFFCEEFGAGIPTWAMGRRFRDGSDVPPEDSFHLPEIRVPLLMGIFGSAFCATLSHYYKEIRPLVQSLTGFSTVDDLVSGRDDDLVKVHPIDPASIPNFAYNMYGKLAKTTPQSIYQQEYIQLMDAGMSNNLPIYPLLRPGRDVDVLIAFDASADIKSDNWLSVADGYARQRGIKGWPVGIGWPKPGESVKQTTRELAGAEADSMREAEQRVRDAKADQTALREQAGDKAKDLSGKDEEAKFEPGDEEAGDLGYCTVWVGTTQERTSEPPPPSKKISEANTFNLMRPDAGIAVVYLPFLSNDRVPDISPGTSEFLSTWNFVYTPEQIDSVVRLARANYEEGKQQIRSTVRAVYERKKQLREKAEKEVQETKLRKNARRALMGHGDQFS